jgi:hypothetical protein
MMKRVLVFVAALAILSSSAMAGIVSVGVLDPAAPASQVKALTVGTDGSIYAVGQSTGGGITQPIIWDAVNGLQQLPNPSGAASDARGVSIIYQSSALPADAVPRIAVSGNIGAIARGYTAPLSSMLTGTWVASGATPNNYTIGAYNTSRTDQSRTDGRTQIAGRNPNNGRGSRFRFYPSVGLGDYPNSYQMESVSEGGVTIGHRRPTGTRQAVYGPTINANAVDIPGGNLVRSEGFGISANGQWMSGLDHSGGTPNIVRAFKWKVGDAAMTVLDAGSYENLTAYAISNDGVAAGHAWTSAGSYNAAVWDTTGVWDSSGNVKLVKDLLDAAGMDTTAWTKLERVTTISDDGMTVGGYGIWAADGSQRGFIATIPEPATLSLLVLGGLALVRRRR